MTERQTKMKLLRSYNIIYIVTLCRQVVKRPLVTIMTFSLHPVRFLVAYVSCCRDIPVSSSMPSNHLVLGFPLSSVVSQCYYHIFPPQTIWFHYVSKVNEFISSDSIHQWRCDYQLLLYRCIGFIYPWNPQHFSPTPVLKSFDFLYVGFP